MLRKMTRNKYFICVCLRMVDHRGRENKYGGQLFLYIAVFGIYAT